MQRRLRLPESGFTFTDSLLQLSVFALLLPLIVLFFNYAAIFLKETDPEHLEWEMYKLDLISYIEDAEIVSIINNGGGIQIIKGDSRISIERYGSLLRKQRDGLGHEVMLTDVENARFTATGGFLTVAVAFENGITKEDTYAIPAP